MDEREHEIRNISEYVESQTLDEEITHAERMMTQKVLGETYEVWDVHTTGDRYWVVTNPTNLYSQDDVKSASMCLTLHLGVAMQLADRSRVDTRDEIKAKVDTAWRRFEQAVEAFNQAHEAEAFQAVGVRCRESLLRVADEIREEIANEDLAKRPANGDFKGWAEVLAERLEIKRLGEYVKRTAEAAWDVVVWLQHYRDATPWDAEIALDATQHTVATIGVALFRLERGKPDRCPRCESYRIDHDGVDISDDPTIYRQNKVCRTCEHTWGETFTQWDEATSRWIDIDPPALDSGALARPPRLT